MKIAEGKILLGVITSLGILHASADDNKVCDATESPPTYRRIEAMRVKMPTPPAAPQTLGLVDTPNGVSPVVLPPVNPAAPLANIPARVDILEISPDTSEEEFLLSEDEEFVPNR